ncbi:MAG: T9SS type A sorting domain-containing protein, partial [Ferruginibacter sp.]
NNGGGSNYTFNDAKPLSTDNYYRIKAVSKDGSIQYSPVVKVAALNLLTAISVYPNPVVNAEMSVRFVNQPTGKYGLRLMNKLGQVVYSGKVNVASAIEQQKVSIGNNIAAGTYQLFITAEDGKVTTLQVIVNHE